MRRFRAVTKTAHPLPRPRPQVPQRLVRAVAPQFLFQFRRQRTQYFPQLEQRMLHLTGKELHGKGRRR